jgi:hypothetical protein
MKRLVLLREGHGETTALPILTRRLLAEKNANGILFVDNDVIRARDASTLVKWDKRQNKSDYTEWLRRVALAKKRPNLGGILAVFDGDARTFPAGAAFDFCAATAAKAMSLAASEEGAGKIFSLAIVFACVEYETWIIASAESLVGKTLDDGRLVLPFHLKVPRDDPECHGKGWLEANCPGYRPARDQGPLTELMDLKIIRSKNLRSFRRLENALTQLIQSVTGNCYISTPY